MRPLYLISNTRRRATTSPAVEREMVAVLDFLRQLPITVETRDGRQWRPAGLAYVGKCLGMPVLVVSDRLKRLEAAGHILRERFEVPQAQYPLGHVHLVTEDCPAPECPEPDEPD
jgi:hypothetical protein